MDAQTGKRLGGDDLEVTLIQGLNQRRPDRLVTHAQDPMVGEFAFSGIPIPYNAGNVTYRLVVRKNQYIRFESNLTPSASRGSSSVVEGYPGVTFDPFGIQNAACNANGADVIHFTP